MSKLDCHQKVSLFAGLVLGVYVGASFYQDIIPTGRQGHLGYWSDGHMSQNLHGLPTITFIFCFHRSVVRKWVQVHGIWKSVTLENTLKC